MFRFQHLSAHVSITIIWAISIATFTGCQQTAQPSANTTQGVNVAASQNGEEPTPSQRWEQALQQVEKAESGTLGIDVPIDSSMLAEIARTPQARELLIDAGVITDSDLEVVSQSLPNLEHLRIRKSSISDQGAVALASLKYLRLINIPQSQITAKGISAWQSLPQLNHLRLGGQTIDDQALTAIAQLPQLQSLHLIGPSLTDDGLQNLANAKKLTSFYLDDCPLTESAWIRLKKALPKLHIHVDQVHPDRLQYVQQ